MAKEFGENSDGVHLMWGEYGVCGDAFDINAVDDATEIKPTTKKVVTCRRCAQVIRECRGVRVLTNEDE